jgi:carboxymethylenebutenolidase
VRIFAEGSDGQPGVLVMVHGPGLDHFIETKVRELAAHGFLAASCEVFHRQPDDGTETMTKVGRLRDAEIIADAREAAAYLRARTAAKLAVIGFCMGGRNTYLLAGAAPELWSAICVFYGGNIMKGWGEPTTPLDRTASIAAPMLGLFGDDDPNPTPADVAAIDAELTRHGKPHEFHSYAGAGHAFLNFTNPERHRPVQAADAWAKLLAFLDRHLR